MITTDTIIEQIKTWVEEHKPIPPGLWVDASMKINVLLGNETDELAKKEFLLAEYASKLALESPTMPVAKIKLACASNPLYQEIALLKSKIRRCEEMVRLSKLRARMSDEEYKNQ
jgi:hypothetical protein